MAPLSAHTLDDTSEWAGAFDYIPQRCESCDSLCWRFADQASVSSLLDGKRVTIFHGYFLQLCDWSRRGCPFASLLQAWFPSLTWHGPVNINLCRVRHPKGMAVGLQLLNLSAEPDGRSMYLEMVTDQR